MTSAPDPTADPAIEDQHAGRAPWLPLIVIVLAQLQMAINISALPVSLGPLSQDLGSPATAAATALLLYSMFVAAFVMLGAKIGKLAGERRVLQVSIVVHGAAMGLMATSTDASTMNAAQSIAGIAAAAAVPTLVVLIAANYHGRQQETALGVLAGIPAVASAVTFVIAGFLATSLSWRYSYWLIVSLAVLVLILSFRLAPIPRQPGTRIDIFGVVLSAAAVALILLGFNNLQAWGLLVAESAAPFSLLGLSPAPILILVGVMFGQAFFAWSNRRVAANRQPLLAMEVLDSREEKGAVIAFLAAGSLGLAVGFLIPLYVQIIQGRTPLFSAVAILPYTAAIAVAGVLSVRLYDRFAPRSLGIASFVLIAIGLVVVAFTVGNDWSTVTVILGLILVGIGEGTLLTLLFNVLVSASPKRLAGDVAALRGVANNVSNALGAAFASVVAVGLLGMFLTTAFSQSELPPELSNHVLFDDVDFVTNDELRSVFGATAATPDQVETAIAINETARLRALRGAFLIVAGISLLSIFPAARLPKYVPRELSAKDIVSE
ncbi:MFS transporter [Sinorhizobium mexicanum]|uniref:MFS transporter n=1 Tax=Sinorhizobium mexicanum TaxID=375549 RepID=A0A859QTH5_9HYPH|nr:MFS transporter [Sinorhizobium mexicanum]MBP1883603.1 MFS family permease [Sinorhizobium mexicanum]QLL62789.1 MFS transporter [Sinorhizobium mexicanum]